MSRDDIEKLLNRSGDERLLAKAKGFTLEMASCDSEQVLYRGILEALGYSSNRKPFRLLADRVPILGIYGLKSEPQASRQIAIRALLMSASGLKDDVSEYEARLIRRLRPYLPRVKPIAPDSWNFFRVRPSNHPLRRIEGAAFILDSFMDTGLLRGIESLLMSGSRSHLERSLIVPKCVGKQRAWDIIINVVLPFFVAFSDLSGNKGLRTACLEMYGTFPKLSGNEVTREMTRILGLSDNDKLIGSARSQQGLMHLYRQRWHVGRQASVGQAG